MTIRPGTHPLYRGEVDYKLFDEIPLQLFERNIFYTVFVCSLPLLGTRDAFRDDPFDYQETEADDLHGV